MNLEQEHGYGGGKYDKNDYIDSVMNLGAYEISPTIDINAQIGTKVLYSNDGQFIYVLGSDLIKYDLNLNVVATKYGYFQPKQGFKIDSSGNLFACTSFPSDATKSMYLHKFDGNLNEIWKTKFGVFVDSNSLPKFDIDNAGNSYAVNSSTRALIKLNGSGVITITNLVSVAPNSLTFINNMVLSKDINGVLRYTDTLTIGATVPFVAVGNTDGDIFPTIDNKYVITHDGLFYDISTGGTLDSSIICTTYEPFRTDLSIQNINNYIYTTKLILNGMKLSVYQKISNLFVNVANTIIYFASINTGTFNLAIYKNEMVLVNSQYNKVWKFKIKGNKILN